MYDRTRPQLPTPVSYADSPSPVRKNVSPRAQSAASLDAGGDSVASPPPRAMGARRVSLRRPPSITVGRSARSPKAVGRPDAAELLGSPIVFADDVTSVEAGLPGVITRHHHRMHSVIDSCILASKEDGAGSVGAASAAARLVRRGSHSTAGSSDVL